MDPSAVALELTALHLRETRETSLDVKFPYCYGKLGTAYLFAIYLLSICLRI